MATTVEKDIGGGSNHYPSLSAFISALPADLRSGTGTDEIWIANVYPGGGGSNGEWTATSVQMFLQGNSHLTSATNYVHIRAASGQSFKDHASKLTNALRYNPANGVALRQTSGTDMCIGWGDSPYLILEGLQIASDSSIPIYGYNGPGRIQIKNCIVQANGTTVVFGAHEFWLINSVFYSRSNSGNATLVDCSGTVPKFHNCTFHSQGSTSAIVTNTGDGDYYNNLYLNAVQCSTVSFVDAGSNNATTAAHLGSDGTDFGTGNLLGVTAANMVESVTASSEDYRTKAGASIINAGVRQATYTADLDIVGSARSTTAPTIGAWEATSTPTAPSGVTASSVTASGASISWTDNSSDETGFKVQTAPSPFSSWTDAPASPAAANATSLSVTGMTNGVTYKARVAATNANGDSAWVESSEFTTASGLAGRALLLGVG